MGYHAGKPIESVVNCFYKITGTIKHRFLTNRNARTILVFFINTYNIRYLPYDYKTLIDLSKINAKSLVDLKILRDPAKILTLFYSLYSEHQTNLTV